MHTAFIIKINELVLQTLRDGGLAVRLLAKWPVQNAATRISAVGKKNPSPMPKGHWKITQKSSKNCHRRTYIYQDLSITLNILCIYNYIYISYYKNNIS
jgi:hypothetical protein